ncbi:MAG: hypothetical protein ABW110_00995 [Steroidobacteraceae bacterium]
MTIPSLARHAGQVGLRVYLSEGSRLDNALIMAPWRGILPEYGGD